jgi:hypothetical protein
VKKILKRCEKCGGTSEVSPQERRCKRPSFGPNSYACWGRLAAEEKPEQPKGPPPTLREEAAVQVAKARRMSALFQQRLAAEAKKIAHTAAQLKKWEGRLARYAAKAAMTDEEIAADRKTRSERAKRKRRIRRGIEL